MGQKGKTVNYVTAYLAKGEEKEEEGRRRRRRAKGDRRERVRLREEERSRERERKLILGSRDALKTQRFRLGFLPFFFFPSLAA